ncbi:hypothetical protein IWQ56_004370, partial [Coemansia nantahalensis]
MARRQSQEAFDLGAVGAGGPQRAGRPAGVWGLLRRLSHRTKVLLLAAGSLALFALLLCANSLRDSSTVPPPPMQPVPDAQVPDVQRPDVQVPDKPAENHKETVAAKCSELPIPAGYWSMQAAPAFVEIPQAGDIGVGASVCVRVVVPAKELGISRSFAPFPDTPWDSILLDLVGAETGISVPVELQMANNTQNYRRDAAHVYQADVVLHDADRFKPEGYIEFRGARWNGEDHLETQVLEPEPLAVAPDVAVRVTDRLGNDQFGIGRYLQLPLCTVADADGRWVAADKLPFDAELAPAPDNYNRVWLPYT